MSSLRRKLLLIAWLVFSIWGSAQADPPDAKVSVKIDAYGDALPHGAIARLGTIRLRHGGQIGSVAFSPDGKILASGAADHLVKFWDPATGKEMATLKGHTGNVWSVAFSPDGKTLATGSSDKSIKLWDLSHWQTGGAISPVLTLTGHKEPIRCVAFSPDGKSLATAGEDTTIKLWDLSHWRAGGAKPPVFTLKGHRARVFSVAFSPDGKTLASGSDDKILKLWDLTVRQEKASWQAHDDALVAVAFSPNGKTLASGGTEGSLKVWDLTAGQTEGVKPPVLIIKAHDSWVFSLAFSPDGKTLASGSWDFTVKLWDTARLIPSSADQANGRAGAVLPVRTLEGHSSLINTVAFSPDGKTLASGGGDNVVKLWDVNSGKAKLVPKLLRANDNQVGDDFGGPHVGGVRAVAFSPDGQTVATGGSTDRTIKLWHLSGPTTLGSTLPALRLTRQTGRVFCLAFSPDGKSLASAGAPGFLMISDVATGTDRTSFQASVRGFQSLAFSPDGRTLASASFEGPIRLWDLDAGKEKRTFGGRIRFSCVAFNPDGTRIAAGGGEGTIKVWDVATGREWASLTHGDDWVYSVAFSPDGKTLAAGTGDDEVILCDVVASNFIGALHGHQGMVRSVSFSPDGKTLASAGEDQMVKLWDLTKCRSGLFSRQAKKTSNVWYRNPPESKAFDVHDFAGHVADVTGVAFSPDGAILASSSQDTTVLLWDVANLRTEQEKKASPLKAEMITSCWNDLAGENAAKAYEVIWTLASVPGQAVPFIRDYLQAAPQPDRQRMAQLVVELDDNDFSVRRNAAEELEKLQDLAGPFLHRQLTKQLSLEARRRVERLLEKIDCPVTAPELLRALRAIEVLEHIATSEAREVLQSLAKGAPEARLTQEAKASLGRLQKRTSTTN